MGPRRQEEQLEWTWAAEELPVDLELAWMEWLRAAEAAWCRIHDLCGTQRRPFLARSQGLVIDHVSLGATTRGGAAAKRPQLGVPLRRLVAQAVGSMDAWRKGRASQGTLQQSVNLLASILLPDLRPGTQAGIFRHKKLWHTLYAKLQPVGDWDVQVTRVMVFVKCHTQQAVNVAAVDSARCWRQWAKEACQGSAGAAHGFSEAGLDVGDVDGLAGPQLLVNKWGRGYRSGWIRAETTAKQLADQEDMGEPLPRPSLEEVDNVCKTYKHTAGLGRDCINRKAILQLPVELRARFIDLLMAFEAELVNPLSWSHMMVLRPKPSGGHRTIGLTVAPLRVLSRLRRPLAQKWENEHDAPYFLGCQGKACDRAPLHHGGGSKGAAAFGGFPVTRFGKVLRARRARPPLGRRPKHQFSHAIFGLLVRFMRRLAFSRHLQVRHFSFLGLWDHSSRLQWGHNGGLMLATLLETVAARLPTYRLWNVVDDISGHEAGRLLVEGLQARDLPLSPRANQKSLSMGQTSSSMPFCSSWRCSGSTSATRPATWEPICSWAGGRGGARRQGAAGEG